MIATTAEDLHDLLNGIGAVLWPIFAFVVVIMFRMEVKDLLRRLRKGKVLGQEIELDESLDRAGQAVSKVQEASGNLPTARPEEAGAVAAHSVVTDDARALLESVSKSATAGIVIISSDLEREMRHLLAITGHLGDLRRAATLRSMAEVLRSLGAVPAHLAEAVAAFADVRNKVVHGRGVTDEEVVRAIDIGLTLLRVIQSVPAEHHFVAESGVPVFSDAAGNEPMNQVWAVVLNAVRPDGSEAREVFPTTRLDYDTGKEVTWEWNRERQYGPAWYKDHQSGQMMQAWIGSIEFVGRHIEEI